MDIDVAARQGKGVDVRAIDHSELIGQLAAVTVLRHPLTDLLHIPLQLLVGVTRIFLEDLLVVTTAEVEFLLLAHHHKVAAAGGRIDRTTGQLQQQGKQHQYAQDHGNTSNMALSVNGSIQRACPARKPPRLERSITQPRASIWRPSRLSTARRSKLPNARGAICSTSESPISSHRPPPLRSIRCTCPRSKAKPPRLNCLGASTGERCQSPARACRALRSAACWHCTSARLGATAT